MAWEGEGTVEHGLEIGENLRYLALCFSSVGPGNHTQAGTESWWHAPFCTEQSCCPPEVGLTKKAQHLHTRSTKLCCEKSRLE